MSGREDGKIATDAKKLQMEFKEGLNPDDFEETADVAQGPIVSGSPDMAARRGATRTTEMIVGETGEERTPS
ncbi:hypothetical protein GTO89_07675 [Heliobacterium gestii]|uniref:Uncharacterized protein n=1 Tax=Heliomicrobium gestii TaxID=2699 RepID=A0A845LJ63_HELGE|nr:hypothetical protein [Heliomicrobium gestii]MBM7866293.1 hypothetical protein [Heliomicrobium gestii]MZP42916.1 hypothetical protein [Heliomicrobium gestii]